MLSQEIFFMFSAMCRAATVMRGVIYLRNNIPRNWSRVSFEKIPGKRKKDKKSPVFKGKILKNRRNNLAQKAGFEPALRLSHTTPLAGEPLEPLGYFCMARTVSLRCYNTIAYFSVLVKAFYVKIKKFVPFPLRKVRADEKIIRRPLSSGI